MFRRGFTLIELLVVIAIIAILAAILFPVFAQAKAAAKKAVSVSNNKQITLGALMYMNDYDDRFMIGSYNNTFNADPATRGPDAVPLQMAYPYIKNLRIMIDPMDSASDSDRLDGGGDGILPDPNTVSPAYRATQILLNWCAVADWGINSQYFDPTYVVPGGLVQVGVSQSEIQRPADVYMALSSVWGRRAGGAPYGGGSFAVDAPCIWDTANGNADTRPEHPGGSYSYYWLGGWNLDQPQAPNEFGGVWPWHTGGKVVVISFADGHAKSAQLSSLTTGCNVLDGWTGSFNGQKAQYAWATTF